MNFPNKLSEYEFLVVIIQHTAAKFMLSKGYAINNLCMLISKIYVIPIPNIGMITIYRTSKFTLIGLCYMHLQTKTYWAGLCVQIVLTTSSPL